MTERQRRTWLKKFAQAAKNLKHSSTEYAEFFFDKTSLGGLSASAVNVPNPTWNELYRAGK
jgi:truncated hemoglobin YjbI